MAMVGFGQLQSEKFFLRTLQSCIFVFALFIYILLNKRFQIYIYIYIIVVDWIVSNPRLPTIKSITITMP